MEHLSKDDCVIEQAILHRLDNRKDEPTLADSPLPLGPALLEFIAEHVAASLGNCNVAVFEDRASGVVSTSCEAALSDSTAFVPQSRLLARTLFGFMRPLTIKPGALLFLTFSNRTSGDRYAGILKLDDTRAFMHQETEKGIRVVVNEHALPDPRTKLDKAAFVLPASRVDLDYDLQFLDKGHSKADGGSKYFPAFLACRAPQTNQEKTRIFNRETEQWIQQHKNEFPETVREGFLREFKYSYLLNNQKVSVQEFAEQALGTENPALRDSLVQHLQAHRLRDAEFEVELPPSESRRTVYQFSMGAQKVEIRGLSDAVRELVDIEEPSVEQPYYRVTIKADDWKQLAR